MIANDVMYKVRLYIGDTYKSKMSDWEIINGINDALRLMAEESARLSGSLFRMNSDLTIINDSASLPSEYLSLIKAFDSAGIELFNVHTDIPEEGEFSVSGGVLHSGEDSVELWYFGYPSSVISASSTIDLPESYSAPLARITTALLLNKIEDAVALAGYFMGDKKHAESPKG